MSRVRFGIWAAFFLVALPVAAAIISRTITIDGDMGDWKGTSAPYIGQPDITANPGQFNNDAEGTIDPADLDFPIASTGRDLEGFSLTFDANNMYVYVKRYSSTSNFTDWWFYLDTDNDGLLEDDEYVWNVAWQGNNRETKRGLHLYIPSNPSGDPLIFDNTNDGVNNPTADGYDMPGTIRPSKGRDLDVEDGTVGLKGGSVSGLEMESFIKWSSLGLTGPTTVGFHVSSSNGTNIPNQIDDNMNGIGENGSTFAFADLQVSKSAPATNVLSGEDFVYTVTVTNLGDSDATGVTVLDDVSAAGLTFVSAVASQGSYDVGTGIWTIGDIVFDSADPSSTAVTLDLTVRVSVTVQTDFTNTASVDDLNEGDPDSSNDLASAAATVIPVPDLVTMKSSQAVADPVNGTTNPKAIPSSEILYFIDVTNVGYGASNTDSVFITDPIPDNTELFVGDLGAGASLIFVDGDSLGSVSSGLNFVPAGISYSDDPGPNPVFDYVPGAGVDYDPAITFLRVDLGGVFNAGDGAPPDPRFQLRFKVRIK